MKEWTRAERYKKITDHPEEYFVALAEKVDASAFGSTIISNHLQGY